MQLFGGASEELNVLRVGTRPATFDVVHTEKIELLGNAQLVFYGRRHTFNLKAVSQCCVKNFDHVAHGFSFSMRVHSKKQKSRPVGG